MASSGMGGWVPRAKMTSKAEDSAPTWAKSVLKTRPTGAVRVMSGTMSRIFWPGNEPVGQVSAMSCWA